MAGIRVTVRARARNGCSFGPAHLSPKAVAEMALAVPPRSASEPGKRRAVGRCNVNARQTPTARPRAAKKERERRCALFP